MVFIFGSSSGECSAPYWRKGCRWLPRELLAVPGILLEPERG